MIIIITNLNYLLIIIFIIDYYYYEFFFLQELMCKLIILIITRTTAKWQSTVQFRSPCCEGLVYNTPTSCFCNFNVQFNASFYGGACLQCSVILLVHPACVVLWYLPIRHEVANNRYSLVKTSVAARLYGGSL